MSDDLMFHLVPAEYYRDCDSAAVYTPASFETDGFIHCTDGVDNVTSIGNAHYKDDRRMYIVLVIDRTKVRAEIKYEDPARVYPHIYGPLNRDAITDIVPILRASDGTFLRPNLKR